MNILNIAAGKFEPLDLTSMLPTYTLNVDTSYMTDTTAPAIERSLEAWGLNPDRISTKRYLNMDVFEYMERTRIKFDRVCIYRFLEHVSFTQVEYFIYLVSTVLAPGGDVDIIVPDYTILSEMILNEEGIFEGDPCENIQAHNIKLTTELLNEPSCPHASIWTQARMKYFWQLEERFKVTSLKSGFKFDGRDLYLRATMERTE
jgi:hypothetical protein